MNEDALVHCISELKKPTVEVHYGNVLAKGKTSKVQYQPSARAISIR
jgi:hypothetical protein